MATLCLGDEPQLAGVVEHPPIREASGLVESRQYPGVLWTLCDSQNDAAIYAIDDRGRLIREFAVTPALNVDWESLAIDNQGYLYIGDVGNNAIPGGFPRRRIFSVREPDPRRLDGPAFVRVERTYDYIPPRPGFDVEGMFVKDAKLYLIEKSRTGNAAIYDLELASKHDPSRPLPIHKVAELAAMPQITGADLSADEGRLAVSSYDYVASYTLSKQQAIAELSRIAPRIIRFERRSIEGCAWMGDRLMLIGEDRRLEWLDTRP